ncbi:MAG: multidrug efflux system outer membrane protein, partial [Francisellaceae bacterium]
MKIYQQIKRVITVSSVLLLAGCSYFNPSYDKPETPLPAKWQKPQKENIDLTKFAWWKQLNDPTLNGLVNDALIDNNQIQIAMANVIAAQTDLDKAKYAWIPSFGLSGNGVVGQAFATDFSNKSGSQALDGISRNNSQQYQAYIARLSVDYNLNIMQLYHGEKVASLNLSIQQQIKKAANLSIINQVTVAYFSLLTAKQQVKIQRQIALTQNQLVMASKKSFFLGALSEIEVSQSEQDLYDAQSQLETIRYDIGKYENVLRLLTNQNPGEVETSLSILTLKPQPIPAGLSSTILQNRPDVVMSEFQLQQANANIGLARSQFFPTIDLTSFLGGASLALNSLFTVNTG